MKFKINGGKPLRGTINVSGAKNAALKMVAASLLFEEELILKNAPKITDLGNMIKLIENLGGKAKWSGNTLSVKTEKFTGYSLPVALTKSLRGAVVLVGPLLSKYGKAMLPVPGGCAIGSRPLTAHLNVFNQLGVRFTAEGEKYFFEVSRPPQEIVTLVERSVTATENAILFLATNRHTVVLENCAAEPEIDDLIEMLNKAGANIKRIRQFTLKITGAGKPLQTVSHTIIGDRIEAGTWMVAGLLLGNPLKISGINPDFLAEPIRIARAMGGIIDTEPDAIRTKKSNLVAGDITTGTYPHFPTDLQSPFGLLATQAQGKSIVNETMFEDRLKYLEELQLMGANVKFATQHKAAIFGATPLIGKRIHSVDLRAGATMILAGIVASGETVVENGQVIDRGYQDIEIKLRKIGASITRI